MSAKNKIKHKQIIRIFEPILFPFRLNQPRASLLNFFFHAASFALLFHINMGFLLPDESQPFDSVDFGKHSTTG